MQAYGVEKAEAIRRLKGEFLGSHADAYQKAKDKALARHKSLLGIFECSDALFYDADADARLSHFGLASYRRVMYQVVGGLDFDADPTAVEGRLNENMPRLAGTHVTGDTSLVSDGSGLRTVIFMRESIGEGGDDPEVAAGLKLGVLFHEIGHVTDIENAINLRDGDCDLVRAEAFAHHYACRELVASRFKLVLGHYLAGIEKLAGAPSEYMRVAARQVMDSHDWAKYKSEVSPFYGEDDGPAGEPSS